MKLLLHACCGPCSLFPLQELKKEGAAVTLLYANPNIHPYKEWKERKKSLVALAELQHIPYIVDKDYPLEDFLWGQLEAADRCEFCYRTRLDRAADEALAGGFDAFSTTLLVSIYQKHELIRAVGEEIGREKGIPFVYRDFREGFRWAQQEAKRLELYRQQYCGCIFSERDARVKRRPSAANKKDESQ